MEGDKCWFWPNAGVRKLVTRACGANSEAIHCRVVSNNSQHWVKLTCTCLLPRTTRLSHHFKFSLLSRPKPRVSTVTRTAIRSYPTIRHTISPRRAKFTLSKTKQTTTLNSNNNKVYLQTPHRYACIQCMCNKKHPEERREVLVKQPERRTLCLMRASFFCYICAGTLHVGTKVKWRRRREVWDVRVYPFIFARPRWKRLEGTRRVCVTQQHCAKGCKPRNEVRDACGETRAIFKRKHWLDLIVQ